MRALHAVQINAVPAPAGRSAAATLAHWPSLADIPAAAASDGVHISVVQAAAHDERLRHGDVDYRFVDVRGTSGAALGRRLAEAVAALDADVMHLHGLGFPAVAGALGRRLPHVPLLLQDHADRAPRRWWRRTLWRRAYRHVAGLAFTSLELALPFADAQLFAPSIRLFEIPESSCRFLPGDRAQARRETGLRGNPTVLWVGHLAAGKDPLVALDGVAQAARYLPELQLWCVFGSAPLRAQVEARIRRDPWLAGRVHLLGAVPHARVETLMRAADLFLSASRSESCGYAALEAMACGTTPVLSDIPAFRVLTGERIGHRFPCGDAEALAAALIEAAGTHRSSAMVRAHFDARLSFAAVGRRWRAAYETLAGQRSRATSSARPPARDLPLRRLQDLIP